MLPGYHLFFRHIAGKLTRKNPDQPRENLAVEDKGEKMSRLPLSYKFHSTGRPKVDKPATLTVDQVQEEKTSDLIRAEDFPRDGYIGEGVYYE
jgi:hypothetical protein